MGVLHMSGLRTLSLWLAAGLAVVLLTLAQASSPVVAQQAVGIDPGRDCQTVRTCNFSRTGRVRGCLSSYTCRTCRLVAARCSIAGETRCREMVCSWGG
jgi:hypothetical protein